MSGVQGNNERNSRYLKEKKKGKENRCKKENSWSG